MAVELNAPPVVVVLALEQEAAPLRRRLAADPRVEILVSGVGARAAEQATAQRLRQPPRPALVIAAGFCGALRPGLRIGDIVWDEGVATVPHVLATPGQKQRWAAASTACAVDLESAAIRDVCHRHQIPCRVIRAVSDRWNETIPPEVLASPVGRFQAGRWLYCLLRRPALLTDLLRLWRNSRRAARRLAQAVCDGIDEHRRILAIRDGTTLPRC